MALEYVSAANLELVRDRASAAVMRNLRRTGFPAASCFDDAGRDEVEYLEDIREVTAGGPHLRAGAILERLFRLESMVQLFPHRWFPQGPVVAAAEGSHAAQLGSTDAKDHGAG